VSINISDGIESGNLTIKILTTNTVDIALLTEDKFNGKVIQPGADAVRAVGEHGLAMSIRIEDNEIINNFLLDTGGLMSTIIENSKVFKVNLGGIEKLVLSHGHLDHFGGLTKVIPLLKEGCEIILNPECYYQNHVVRFREGEDVPVEDLGTSLRKLIKEGIIKKYMKFPVLNRSIITKLANEHNIKIIETRNPQKLHRGGTTSGEIRLFDTNEITRSLYISKEKKIFEKYMARDETSIYINVKDKGLVILTGCGHVGVINTIKHAQKLTGINEIYAIIGGLHKIWGPIQTIEDLIQFIEELNPEVVCGMHCTGFEFNKRLSMRDHPSHTLGVTGTEFHL